jgi:hypothetical protein
VIIPPASQAVLLRGPRPGHITAAALEAKIIADAGVNDCDTLGSTA